MKSTKSLLAKSRPPAARKEEPPSTSAGNGPVIADDGTLRYISPSQMERFDPEAEGGCERKWWYRYRARIRDKETAAKSLGTQVHAQLEHYLKTGDAVLGDLARAGLRFIPKHGPDLLVELEIGEPAWPGPLLAPVVSEIYAAGVPLVLKIDLMHRRGTFLDDNGELHAEPTAFEVRDWKTTKQINDELDELTGEVLKRGYAKQGDVLAATWQMVSYGEVGRLRWPDKKLARLSHGYFQSQGKREASLRSAVITVGEVAARWRRADYLVERMKSIAATPKVEDVPANYGSCQAYGGCSYRQQCPRDPKRVLQEVFGGLAGPLMKKSGGMLPQVPVTIVIPREEENGMSSLLKKAKERAGNTSAADAAVAAEKKALVAEEKAARTGSTVAPPDESAGDKTHEPHEESMLIKIEAMCGHMVPLAETSKLANGDIKHIGCPGAGKDLPKSTAAKKPEPAAAPQQDDEEEIEFKPGEECPVGGSQVELDMDAAVEKKYECACGQGKLKIKPQKMDGKYFAIVPKHDVPGEPEEEEKPEPAKAETKPVAAAKATEALQAAASAIVLYLDAVEDGVATTRLEAFVDEICRDLEKQYNVADVRCAGADTPLGFGKYKGAVAALVRARPPAPGAYSVSSASELGFIAFEALRTLPGVRAVWGVK